MDEIRVRRAAPPDADGLAGVHVRGWQVGYRGLLPDAVLDGLSVPDRAATWRHRLTHPVPTDATVLVAVRGDDLLGFCSVGWARDDDAPGGTHEVWAFYVDPGQWRRGVGRALDRPLVDHLTAVGATRSTLWVLTGNRRARGFYEACGWVSEGTTRVDHRDGPVPVDLPETRYVRSVPPAGDPGARET